MAIIKHLHKTNSNLNPRLYFVLNNRLFAVDIITPKFNDYGEYRLSFEYYSELPYVSDPTFTNIPIPNFPDISITDEESELLVLMNASINNNLSSNGKKVLYKKYPDHKYEICGGVLESGESIIINDNNTEKINVYDTVFKKIFHQILYNVIIKI